MLWNRCLQLAAPGLLAAALCHPPVNAQITIPGFVNLPRDDFVWTWGDREEALAQRFSDIEVRGGEAGFNCKLVVKLHPSGRVSPGDAREIENQLRSSLAFIQDSATAMYYMDQRRELDWAVLDCDKMGDRELTEAERQERVDRALEKARAEQARRRAREQR